MNPETRPADINKREVLEVEKGKSGGKFRHI